jgi:tetratricopeptide (TPR) repeat protein
MHEASGILSPQELSLFSERIARSLRQQPLDLDGEEHRELVAGLVRDLGEASHYRLLALGPSASGQKVQEGYERLARLVHPANARRLGLEGRERVLELLFERVTQAYLTLSHHARRQEYDRTLTPEERSHEPAAKPRAEENRERARSYYNRSRVLAASEEYHFAIELLREAVRVDPQPEYYALLGDMQAKNVFWLRHAAESYAKALQLGGPDPKVAAALERVRERMAEGEAGPAEGSGG